MKMVNCNNWFYHYVHGNKGSVFLANGDSLYYNFITIFGGRDRFYYMLTYMLYNILDEDGYLDEDD
jgi:hypothetical protein